LEASEILESIDIVEYIGQYIEGLEQRGREFWGLSCFTEEKTPSFSIDPDKNVWFDFSSGRGGNLVAFVMAHDNVSVNGAMQILKKYAHITEDKDGEAFQRLEATRIAKRYRDKLRKAPKMIAKPLPSNVMDRYEFRRDKLQLWVDEGISWETLERFGVRYDAFDDRIVYPIKDYDGNIISVCGRTCDPDYKEKKLRKYTYLSQLGTLDTVYGYSDNRQAILDAREIIIFEGAKSCMKAREWGFENTAALLTSHLSTNQMRFLIKLAGLHNVTVVFALDSDIDITKDENIRRLCKYAKVQWIRNRDGILPPKDSPTDQGEDNFIILYQRRENFDPGTTRRQRAQAR